MGNLEVSRPDSILERAPRKVNPSRPSGSRSGSAIVALFISTCRMGTLLLTAVPILTLHGIGGVHDAGGLVLVFI